MDRCDCKSDRPQQKKDNCAVPTTRDVPEVDKNRETLERTVERYENVGESVRKHSVLEMKLVKYCQEEEKI